MHATVDSRERPARELLRLLLGDVVDELDDRAAGRVLGAAFAAGMRDGAGAQRAARATGRGMKRKRKPQPRVKHPAGTPEAVRIVREFVRQQQQGEVKLFTPREAQALPVAGFTTTAARSGSGPHPGQG